jgi:hypothetical protein
MLLINKFIDKDVNSCFTWISSAFMGSAVKIVRYADISTNHSETSRVLG